MIPRLLSKTITERLEQFPSVALLGARQVGKTTLAKEIGRSRSSIHLDLELPTDREKLSDAQSYLSIHQDKLVIIDEVQRAPELFQALRVAIDKSIDDGRTSTRFLLLASASMDLLQQSGESLAGRIAYEELFPLSVSEISNSDHDKLWLRGGFPRSLLSDSDKKSSVWRENFIRTYLERDIPQFGPRIAAETLRRFWTMLAHNQGALFNAASLARSLAVDGKTVARYLDLMVDLLLLRRLPPYQVNAGKRLVKSPKVYVRDSGLVHALLGIHSSEQLLGHPVAGGSWEGFVIENLLSVLPWAVTPFFYRTSAGAEIDLVLEWPNGELWAVEIKRSSSARPEKGFHFACEDLKPARSFVVYAGKERFPLPGSTEAIGLKDLVAFLSALR